jgi:hypothetical protein
VTPAGAAVAVWRSNGGAGGLKMARRPAGGTWGANFPLFASGTIAAQAAIDLNATGDAVVGFRRRIGGGFFFTQAVFQPATSSVAATSIFNPGAGTGDDDEVPAVGIDNAGNAAVMFGRVGTVKVSNKPAGSNVWSSVAGTAGNVDTTSAANPRMAWNDSGQQAATWTRSSGATLQASTRSDLGAFAAPTAIGPAAMGVTYFGGEVAIDPAGVAIATINGSNGLKSARTAGASWNAVNDVATSGNPNAAQIGADAQGNAAVAFSATNASFTNSIMAAGFDGAGPRLDDIVFPANAATGQAFSYSVSPIDVWSTVASTAWAFGEGSSATGASGSFTYPAAGGFAATVTSTDSRGNQSSAVRNVTVSGAGGPGGGGDTTAPVFASARLTNKTFAVNRRGAAEQPASARAKRGTTFVYSLSEAGRVVFTIQRALPGRRVAGRCRKPTARNRTRPRCTRFVRFASFAQNSTTGANRKRFSGKIGRRSLRPGKYRAVLVARDAAGNRSSARRLAFRVVRR